MTVCDLFPRFAVGLLSAATLMAGCRGDSPPERPPVTPVNGTVLLNGAPVDGATIVFKPMDATGQPAVALSDSQGNFVTTTYTTGDGLRPGTYRVGVSKFERNTATTLSEDDPNYGLDEDMPATEMPDKNTLPERYSPDSTGPAALQLTVGTEPITDYKIELTP